MEQLGYKVDRCKLYCGDYSWATNQSICVDTKQDLQEVCANLTKQHDRFRSECERARNANIRLVILVQEPNIKTLTDVVTWYNWRKKKNPRALSGKQLFKIMSTMSDKYGVEWQFTNRKDCAKRIIEILGG